MDDQGETLTDDSPAVAYTKARELREDGRYVIYYTFDLAAHEAPSGSESPDPAPQAEPKDV